MGAGSRHRDRARRDDHPRRRRRGTRPVHPARRRRHRGQRLGRHRGRPAARWPPVGPASSPGATSSPARRRSSTRSPRDAAPPRPSTSTWPASPTASGAILDDRPLPRRLRTGVSTWTSPTRPRAHAPLPMIQPGLVRGHPGRVRRDDRAGRGGRCFRCDAVYDGPVVEVVAGRGPDAVRRPGRRPTGPASATHDIAGGTP